MKSFLRKSVFLLLLISISAFSFGNYRVDREKEPSHSRFVTLDGQIVTRGIPETQDGIIKRIDKPILRLMRSKSSEGTVLLIPGDNFEQLSFKNEGEKTARFLNGQNFDVAILEYHIGAVSGIRDSALNDAMNAYRFLRTNRSSLGMSDRRLIMMGFTSGAYLAARTASKLNEIEQPDALILISPVFLDETLPGTVYKSVMPPDNPSARLLVTITTNESKALITSCREFTKTWIGYDGKATFNLLSDSAWIAGSDTNPMKKKYNLSRIIKTFLESEPGNATADTNPAAVPVEGYSSARHAEKLVAIKKHKFDLILIGNSITNNFEKSEYQPVWNQFFAPRNALNLGYSGYRTENIIWNIQNGELNRQSPRVVILEIGTNNVDEENYPTRHTAGQLAGGIDAIVKLLREKLPETKIIILRCFPGCYGGPNPTSHRAILERASDIVSGIADGKNIFYCDANHVFLNADGSISKEMMPDWLHPSPEGARAWARAMEPLLSKLMNDRSRDKEIPSEIKK
jgi:lysophospholipase L1-like esterase/alpha/beta superfamily hydrolase